MPQRRRSSQKINELEQTSESIPRSLPTKVQQSTIKHNHQSLISIPILQQSHLIIRLYLAHNNISNLNGIQKFTSLQSVNLSYNNISKIQELRKISNPSLIKYLKIRMNPLPFGYQDYTISIFQNLKTFEDIKITKQSKRQLHLMRMYISKNIIQFFRRMQLLGQIFIQNVQNKQNEMDRVNIISKKNNLKNIITLNVNLLDKIKNLFIYPSQDIIRKISITNSLKIIHQLIEIICQAKINQSQYKQNNFIKQTHKIFNSLVSSILIKFSTRNDKTLINEIHRIKQNKPQLNNFTAFGSLGIFQEEEIPLQEAKITGGGIKIPSLDNHQAKYIQKINTIALKQHPINKLVNWSETENPITLIPLEQTKWHHFYKKYQKQQEPQYLFEQLPIFIYCKQYIEVITELILEKIAQILQFQNYFTKNQQCFQSNFIPLEQNSFSQKNKQILQQKTKSILKKQIEQYNSIFVEQNDQQVELNLSQSDDILSFGDIKHNPKALIQQKSIDKQQISTHQRQNKLKFEQSKKQEFRYNISNYSLYQINLVFKVFRSLKKRISKRKKTQQLKSDLYQ